MIRFHSFLWLKISSARLCVFKEYRGLSPICSSKTGGGKGLDRGTGIKTLREGRRTKVRTEKAYARKECKGKYFDESTNADKNVSCCNDGQKIPREARGLECE